MSKPSKPDQSLNNENPAMCRVFLWSNCCEVGLNIIGLLRALGYERGYKEHPVRVFLLSLCFWFSAVSLWAAESEIIDTGRVNAQIVSSHDIVAPGQTFHIALRTQLDEGWHTYWRNSGDSGEPVQITWAVPDTLSYGEIIWPLPNTIATGPIINYGFEGLPYFPVEFKVSEDAIIGETLFVEADVYYLVCADICVPESTQLSLQVFVGTPELDERWNDAISNAINTAPKPGAINGGVSRDVTDIVFTFNDLPEGADISEAHFFPYAQGVVDHSAPQNLVRGESGLQIRTLPGFDWENGEPETAQGVLRYILDGEPAGQEINTGVGQSVPIGKVAKSAVTGLTNGQSIGLWAAIFGAFIGGLILNLMPCVFPVISIKALSVAKQAHADASIVRREGWIYTAGVVTTFMLLTAILLIVKSGGEAAGWGFQLQSPKVTAALAVLLFVIGLNLLGVFEFGARLQNTGGSLTQKKGWFGTFCTGALAVIVATPCTAPFMAGAIGYALAQPALVTFTVFMALAIGFAAPFLLLSYAPSLLAKLPKPGSWMVRFREFLSFPMFAAAIWLLWVLTQQAGEEGLVGALVSMLLIGFGIWLLKSGKTWVRIIGGISMLAAIALLFTQAPKSAAVVQTVHEAWSPETVAARRAEGKAVFIDFTAAWCVTCKVNKKLVLDRPDVKALFEETNTAFLVADWTNKNDMIADELARHGRSGVPLYLLYSPGHNDVSPVILPQVLSRTVIEDAIKSFN